MSFSNIYVNTCVHLNVSIFNLSMFTEKDGTTINNEDSKKSYIGKIPNFTKLCNYKKNNRF